MHNTFLMNVSQFNQAHECLNRKLLTYAMIGSMPIIHTSFIESLAYMKHTNVPHIIYEDEKSIQFPSEIPKWDCKWFCMENRVKDLIETLLSI
jgi:hypothetical protein